MTEWQYPPPPIFELGGIKTSIFSDVIFPIFFYLFKFFFIVWTVVGTLALFHIVCKFPQNVIHVHIIVLLLFVLVKKSLDIVYKMSNSMRRHHWRVANFDLCSALMAIEQWVFFGVPHLLWHGASVYNGYLRGPVTLTTFAERLAVELSLPVFPT